MSKANKMNEISAYVPTLPPTLRNTYVVTFRKWFIDNLPGLEDFATVTEENLETADMVAKAAIA